MTEVTLLLGRSWLVRVSSVWNYPILCHDYSHFTLALGGGLNVVVVHVFRNKAD